MDLSSENKSFSFKRMSLKKVCSRIKYCSFITQGIFGNKLEKSKVCFQTEKKEEKIFIFGGFVIPWWDQCYMIYYIEFIEILFANFEI